MTSNSSHPAQPMSPFNVAVYAFAASQVIAIPLGHAVLAAAAVGGGYAVYTRLPEPFREKAGTQYAHAKELLRERFARASCKISQTTRHAAIQIQRIINNGVLIILIWAAFAGESFRQIVETVRLSTQVWAGGQEPVFTTVVAA